MKKVPVRISHHARWQVGEETASLEALIWPERKDTKMWGNPNKEVRFTVTVS